MSIATRCAQLVEAMARSTLDQERELVEVPWSRRPYVRTAIRFVVVLAALVVHNFDMEPWSFLAAVVVGWSASLGATSMLTRASAYKSGWLNGRMAMVSALAETSRRGMSLEDWMQAQYEHDVVVIGIPPRSVEEEE